MVQEKSALKTILILCYIPIFLACFCLMLWYVYYLMFLNDDYFISTAYLDEATYQEDETFFIEINYFNNSKGNGVEAFEVKFNFYTDTQLPEQNDDGSYDNKVMYSSGFQTIGGLSYTTSEDATIADVFDGKAENFYRIENAYFYDTEMGGTSFGSLKGEKLIDRDKFIFDINGELCLIQTQGEVYTHNRLWVAFYEIHDVSYFLTSIYETIKTMEDGEHIFAIDLSDYFFVTLQNENGSFDTEIHTSDEQFLFSNIKVNISNNGMISNEQSMFSIVKNDADWTLDNTGREEYWQTQTNYYLTNDDFTVRYIDDGYYAVLKTNVVNYLAPFRNLYLTVNLDLDNFEIYNQPVELKGFTSDAFSDMAVQEINLTSSEARDFYVYDTSNINEHNNINLILIEEVEEEVA